MSNVKKGCKEEIYTPNKIIDFMVDILNKNYKKNITEFLEPAAGKGYMIDRLKYHYNKPILAYDISNKFERTDIIKSDFLKLKNLEYKKGRVTFMNPPFTKGLKFIYKTLEVSDYCITITSSNSFMNFNYDDYYVDDIYFIKKAKFSDGREYGINIIACRKK